MNKLTIILGLHLSLVATASFAGYALRECTVDYQNASNEACGDTYGNAQNQEFSESLNGTVILSPQEQQFMVAVVPRKMQDRFYIRAHAGLIGYGTAMNFKNSSVIANKSLVPITKNASGSQALRGGALGYQWTNAALEIEYLGTGKLHYDPTPIVQTETAYLRSTIQSTGVLINGLYFGDESPSVIPWLKTQTYFIAGVGLGKTTVDATTSVGSTQLQQVQKAQTGISAGLGVGIRGRLTEHFLIDTAIRAQMWPYAVVGPINGALSNGYILKSKTQASAAWFLGLDFMF